MAAAALPAVASLAVLAELDPGTRRSDRIRAVMAWRDDGHRVYQALTAPASLSAVAPVEPALDLDVDPVPRQLHLDLGELGISPCSSCGLTWRTWALPTIPAPLRHLPLAGAVRELARRLGG